MVFGEVGIMRRVGVKRGKGRIKTPPYEKDVREMSKVDAVQY